MSKKETNPPGASGLRAEASFLVREPLRLLGRIAREPLFHFVVMGAILVVAGRVYQDNNHLYRIEISPGHVAQLTQKYALQFGSAPDADMLEALLTRDIHDEMLFREGLALNLDQDDEIVRRRVIQKMQFLMQDLSAPPEPTEQQVDDFYNAHADRYVTPPRATFSHIYFATTNAVSPSEDTEARQRATSVLVILPNSRARAPDLGDPFPDLYDFAAYEPTQVYRLFGHTPFAEAVFSASIGEWSGPYVSAYGWHLIHVDAREPAMRQSLADVRDKVVKNYFEDAQAAANQATFERLAKKFTIVRKDAAGVRETR